MGTTDRIVVPKSDVVGTPEWEQELAAAIKADHRYSERDVSLFAEHAAEAKLNKVWKTAFDDGGTWERWCAERLELPAAYVDSIVLGVGMLRGQGYRGQIPGKQAMAVAAQAEQTEPLITKSKRAQIAATARWANPINGPVLGSDHNVALANGRGESADYLTARIARDRPDILDRMKRGEFRSVRSAAIEAGIVKPTKRHSLPADPAQAGRYMAQRTDRDWFMAFVDAYMAAVPPDAAFTPEEDE